MRIRASKGFILAQSVYHRLRAMFLYEMWFPTYSDKIQAMVRWSPDPVRYASMALALERVRIEGIPGAIAEVGVYRGDTSRFLHEQAPERKLYLFDTFTGFPDGNGDHRFRDTGIGIVKSKLRDLNNVEFRAGIFPETTAGLEHEVFSFVLFDADKYEATMACLNFFYPRMSPGGCFVLHDFNSAESDWAVARAMREFMQGKPEAVIEFPDIGGTAMFRKIRGSDPKAGL
jgi:O-methyltransferase